MKALKFIAGSVMLATAAVATAQTYPYTNPTYVPNMRPAAVTVASNVPAAAATLNNIGTVTVQFAGTCTNLNARLEGSNDGTNFVTLNMYPNQSTTAASAVTSATATGIWGANVSGLSQVRINNSGVTGSACTATMVGSGSPFSLPH